MRNNDEMEDIHSFSVKDLHSRFNLKSENRHLPKSVMNESYYNYTSNSTREESDRSYGRIKPKKSVSFNSFVKVINVESYKYMNGNENLKIINSTQKNNKKRSKPKIIENEEYKEQKCMSQCDIF